MEFEIWCVSAALDKWAIKPAGSTESKDILYFDDEKTARHMAKTISRWVTEEIAGALA